MATENGISPRSDRRTGNVALIVRDHRAHEMNAPMMRNKHDIRFALRRADIRLHRGKIGTMGIGVGARRRARLIVFDLLVHRERAHRRTARPALVRPVTVRQNAGIGEEGDPRSVRKLS